MKKTIEIVFSKTERKKIQDCKDQLIEAYNEKSLGAIIKKIFFDKLDEHFEFDNDDDDEDNSDGVDEW